MAMLNNSTISVNNNDYKFSNSEYSILIDFKILDTITKTPGDPFPTNKDKNVLLSTNPLFSVGDFNIYFNNIKDELQIKFNKFSVINYKIVNLDFWHTFFITIKIPDSLYMQIVIYYNDVLIANHFFQLSVMAKINSITINSAEECGLVFITRSILVLNQACKDKQELLALGVSNHNFDFLLKLEYNKTLKSFQEKISKQIIKEVKLFFLDFLDNCEKGFYYDNTNQKCNKCSTNCLECFADKDTCRSCGIINNKQYYLKNKECLENCGDNYTFDKRANTCIGKVTTI